MKRPDSRTLVVSLCFASLMFATGAFCDEDHGGCAQFFLGGNAQHATDPENPANEVIRINTLQPPLYGTVGRCLNVKINELDNMLEFKAYFQGRSCGGGSPRIELAIDVDGDGKPDANAFGYYGSAALSFGGCAPAVWLYQDLTDETLRWDVSQFVNPRPNPVPGGPQLPPLLPPVQNIVPPPSGTYSYVLPWQVVEAFFTLAAPNHRVISGQLVDDSGWLAGAAGVAYYDLTSIGNATWSNFRNTAGHGFPKCKGDHNNNNSD